MGASGNPLANSLVRVRGQHVIATFIAYPVDTIDRLRLWIRLLEVRLNPVLSASEVESFETHWAFRLPDTYRRFLLELGNGGEGPSRSGLLPFDPTSFVPKAFPFTQSAAWAPEDIGTRERATHGSIVLGRDGRTEWRLILWGARESVWRVTPTSATPMASSFTDWYEARLRRRKKRDRHLRNTSEVNER